VLEDIKSDPLVPPGNEPVVLDLTAIVAMKPLHMNGVHGVFHKLQPIAWDVGNPDIPDIVGPNQRPPMWQQGHRLRPDVCPDKTTELLYRMPVGVIFMAGKPFVVLHGPVHATALRSELPSVDDAPYAAVLNKTSYEVHASVSAKATEQPQLAGRLAEQDELLSEVTHWERPRLSCQYLAVSSDGKPIAAHEIAHRGPGTDLSE